MPTKAEPCTNGPKHTWAFVKNVTTSRFTIDSHGAHGRFSVRGLYRCACGETRVGQSKSGAPGADLREHIGMGDKP